MEYKLANWDNYHYDGNNLDSLDKPFNFIISERELGKTTWFWLKKAWKAFCQKGRTTLVIRRRIADITDSYIDDIAEVINKFNEYKVEFNYKHSSVNSGIVDVYVEDKRFIRIVGLSMPKNRIKSLILRDLKYIVFDEFIADTRGGEKYLDDEAFRFKEIYNTFQRECNDLKAYFLGNPYSMYNPYFVWIGVNTKLLTPGCIIKGGQFAVECGVLSDELRKIILDRNPLYKFDDGYKKYAFFGQAINDANIQLLEKCPDNFRLRHVIRIENKYLYVYSKNVDSGFTDWECTMWACVRPTYDGKNRAVFCFDFKELVEGTILMSKEDKARFEYFRQCERFRRIKFESIEASYLTEEIYLNTK